MENILGSNLEPLNVVSDLGKGEVKAFSYTNTGEILQSLNFDSVKKKVLTSHVYSSNPTPNRFKIEFENQRFELGDNIAKGSHSNENSKVNLHHKLCLLTSVGLLVQGDNQLVNVSAGLPSGHISNLTERKLFEEIVQDYQGKAISIKINGKDKKFIINSIEPESEGLAILPRLKLMLSNNTENVAVIDIGGHNFNLRLFDEAGFSLDDRGISEEEVGINTLLSNFRIALISSLKNKDRKINNNDLKRFIKNRDLDQDMELTNFNGSNSDFVNEFVKGYIEEYIECNLSSHSIKINAKGMKYLFTGGGANLLKPYIEEMFKDNLSSIYFSETAKWDNCISFALNNLFKKNPNKSQIFSTLNKEALNKLPNTDKLDNNNLAQLQSMIRGTQI